MRLIRAFLVKRQNQSIILLVPTHPEHQPMLFDHSFTDVIMFSLLIFIDAGSMLGAGVSAVGRCPGDDGTLVILLFLHVEHADPCAQTIHLWIICTVRSS